MKQELAEKNLSLNQISIVEKYLSIQGTNEEKLDQLKNLYFLDVAAQIEPVMHSIRDLAADTSSSYQIHNPLLQGIKDIRDILGFFPKSKNLIIDLSLARGLNYYTGIIFEIRAKNVSIGSIGGGGRYDNLTGLFGVPDIPGVGISFGVDRIYDVMEELKLFPATVQQSPQFLFFNLGNETFAKIFELMQQLRSKGIRCELFPDTAKFDKQFKYAEKKNIPFAVIIGTEELNSHKAKIKDLATGVQEECAFENLIAYAERMIR